jgi:hypothetical protein
MEASSPVGSSNMVAALKSTNFLQNTQNKIYIMNALKTIPLRLEKNGEVDPLSLTQDQSDLFTVTDEDSGKDSTQYMENFPDGYE